MGRFDWIRPAAAGLAAVLLLGMATGLFAGEPRFTFIILGDRTGSAVPGVFESIVAEAAFLDPDFFITVGDHIEGYIEDGDEIERQWDEFDRIMEAAPIKCYMTPGNHDIWDEQSLEIYKDRFGDPDQSFKVQNTRFIILDVSRDYGFEDLSREQVKWLEKELEKSEDAAHTLVFLHKPFWCEDFSFGRESALHEMFVKHGVTAVFSGHYHRYFYTERDGIKYYGVGSSGGGMWSSEREGSFFCYMIGQVVGDSLRIELVKPNFFTPVDQVTVEGVSALTKFKKESVELSEVRVDGVSLSGTARVSVTVNNSSEKTLRDTARWEVRKGWTVEPERDYIEVPPGEVGLLTVLVSSDGLLFPVPALKICLPYGDEEPVKIERPLNVRRTTGAEWAREAPVIDGDLADAVWAAGEPETDYFGWRGGKSRGDPTSLWIGYDSLNLYIAVKCSEAEPDSAHATAVDRDAFSGNDDHVGVLLQPSRDSEVFYEFLVNPRGAVFDRKIEVSPYGSYVMTPRWDANAEAGALMLPDGWTVEMAVPLEDVGPAGPGSEWGFNFQRFHAARHAVSNFQAPLSYSSSDTGILVFQ
jgi:UDP-2,3-diacylglucosamine pyrophosphatase LpxH